MAVVVGTVAAAAAGDAIVSALTTAVHLASTTIATEAAVGAAGAATTARGAAAAAAAAEEAAAEAAAAAAAAACLAWATLSSRSCRNGPGRSSGVQMRQVLGIGQRTKWLRRLLQGLHHRCSHGSPLGPCLKTRFGAENRGQRG